MGAHGDIKAAQDPPKTQNRSQIDNKSTQQRSNIHPTSTQLLWEFSKQKLLKIKSSSTKDGSIQGYKRARIKRYTEIRTYLLNCSSEFPNSCQGRAQDPPKTENRPQIDPKSTPNRRQIHPKSTKNPPNIDPGEGLQCFRVQQQRVEKPGDASNARERSPILKDSEPEAGGTGV